VTQAIDQFSEHLMVENDNDWNNRILCPDDRCTGTIGPNGQCRVCGHCAAEPNGSEDNPESLCDSPVPNLEEKIEIPVSRESDMPDDDWARRRLCRDESCIGIIGPNGRCGVCGLMESDDH
jgi:hypothetical protein